MAETIAIIRAGSWGTALAIHLARVGHDVRLWARDRSLWRRWLHAASIRATCPKVAPDRVTPSSRPQAALQDARLVVFAVPSHGLRAVARAVARRCRQTPCSSAPPRDSRPILFNACRRCWRKKRRCNPSSCSRVPASRREVAQGLPTALLSASSHAAAAACVQEWFRGPALRT